MFPRSTLIVCSIFLLVLLQACIPDNITPTPSPSDTSIHGVVVSQSGQPIPGAIVRIKATDTETATNEKGQFLLTIFSSSDEQFFLTAWSPGYYINGVNYVQSNARDIIIVLEKHTEYDNSNYGWVSAFSSAGEDGNCENCHAEDVLSAMPFTEWRQDAHALSAENSRFLSMYLGQDLAGNQSPLREYSYDRDYGRFPLRPDISQLYYGPGYKLDFPDTAGNCATCHTPVDAVNAPYETNPSNIVGVGTEGATCDFCHKVWEVRLNSNGLPYANMPGTLSFEFRRPEDGHQFFAGPLDDVAPGEDTYAPVQRESQFCAPCHFGNFWDTQIYNSFGEWLESSYSNPEKGKTCQDCHMPPGQNDHFVRYDKGGVTRDSRTIFSHLMPGASDENLLQNAISLDTKAYRDGEQIFLSVDITNDQTGHYVPTDSPLRQMLLVVEAKGADGEFLEVIDSPLVPDWGGVGDPAQGYYAGIPGKGYAKILMELWTEIVPTGAYWNPTNVVSDTRLAPFETDTNRFIFAAPESGEVTLKVSIYFRRAFIDLMDQKGWDTPDIIMEQESIILE